jgi:hypothetical protein
VEGRLRPVDVRAARALQGSRGRVHLRR